MNKAIGLIFVLVLLGILRPAWAADGDALQLTFDKVKLVHLQAAARRLIVANPAIADVSLETPTLLYIFGKAPGETNLVVLGDDDRLIFSRPLVVAPETERTVSVHVPANEGGVVRTYSCTDIRCVRVPSPEGMAVGAAAPSPSANTPAQAPASTAPMPAAAGPMSSTAGEGKAGR